MCTRCIGCAAFMITDQAMPMCGMCQRPAPQPPPPMRRPVPASIIPTAGSMLVVLVFIAGVAVGTKMAGVW